MKRPEFYIRFIAPLRGLAIIGFGLLLSITGCTSGKGFQASNVAYEYDNRQLAPRPYFVVHHIDAETTEIHFRINSGNLLYMRHPESGQYEARFEMQYQLVPSFENAEILDSGSVNLRDRDSKPPFKAITGSFEVPTGLGRKNYVLRINMRDLNRKVEFETFLRIDRSSPHGSSNFLLTDSVGHVLFKSHVGRFAPFYLKHNSQPKSYFVSYYDRDFPLALPPYSSTNDKSFDLTPDTTYVVRAGESMEIGESGFYHFRLDTTQWQGYTVYSFYDEFPFVANREHLGPPLRYLTTRREYQKISDVFNQPTELKKEVDDFWLNRTGSLERSKTLLEAYYKRVQEANILFTSYLEGWKTDRGIIYVIYGPPSRVYRASTGESWVYGDETSSLSYYFNFLRVNNPFSDNDYALDRRSSYRYGWGQAIEAWRNGHIYNSKDIEREQNEQEQIRYRQRPPYWY